MQTRVGGKSRGINPFRDCCRVSALNLKKTVNKQAKLPTKNENAKQ
jgi:hypothetical protein